MKFVSTRNKKLAADFSTAIFTGMPPDGGLYEPAEKISLKEIYDSFNKKTSFQELSEKAAVKLLAPEIEQEAAFDIVKTAFTFSPAIRKLDESIFLLELFHGPTCAFKDFGAAFLAASMERLLDNSSKRALVLVATSGDTGGAVARAFLNRKGIDVVILYPSHRVSPLQEKQLTTLGGNINALEVKGSFDDCQRMVKEAFLDKEIRSSINLTSANSINPGRLIPQSFYYMYGYLALQEQLSADNANKDFAFCVPSGNFGNLTAGILAREWGLPVSRYIAATNINDVVPAYLKSGIFKPRSSVPTLSNAMDVGNPSNFERLLAIFHNDSSLMSSVIHGETVTDTDTLKTIKEVYEKYGIFIDPHTAVGYRAAKRYLKHTTQKGLRIIILATAHPGKFTETVFKATGYKPDIPETLKILLNKPKKSTIIDPSTRILKEYILSRFV